MCGLSLESQAPDMNDLELIVRNGAWRVGILLAMLGVALALASPVASARQGAAPVRKAVEDLLLVEMKELPGEASYTIDSIDENNNLQACNSLQAFLPAGARLFGRTHVGVRCLGEANWQLFVSVRIRVVSDYLVATRPLAMGDPISDGDVVARRGDLGELPAGVLTREELAVGQVPRVSIGAGQALRADLLRRESVVKTGQQVRLISRGNGFSVSTDGQAMNNAAEGQLARVRTSAGQTISGIARAGGMVEVTR